MMTLTTKQCKLALDIIFNDIELSEMGVPDYTDASLMHDFFERAFLAEQLKKAISENQKENEV